MQYTTILPYRISLYYDIRHYDYYNPLINHAEDSTDNFSMHTGGSNPLGMRRKIISTPGENAIHVQQVMVPSNAMRLRLVAALPSGEGRRLRPGYVTGPPTAVPPPVPHHFFGRLVIRGMDTKPWGTDTDDEGVKTRIQEWRGFANFWKQQWDYQVLHYAQMVQ